jgi:hypothetical protein
VVGRGGEVRVEEAADDGVAEPGKATTVPVAYRGRSGRWLQLALAGLHVDDDDPWTGDGDGGGARTRHQSSTASGAQAREVGNALDREESNDIWIMRCRNDVFYSRQEGDRRTPPMTANWGAAHGDRVAARRVPPFSIFRI